MKSYRSQGMVLGIQYLSMVFLLYRFVLNRTYILSFSVVLHLQQWSPLKRALVANALIVPYSLYRWRKYVTNDVNLYEAAVQYDGFRKKWSFLLFHNHFHNSLLSLLLVMLEWVASAPFWYTWLILPFLLLLFSRLRMRWSIVHDLRGLKLRKKDDLRSVNREYAPISRVVAF